MCLAPYALGSIGLGGRETAGVSARGWVLATPSGWACTLYGGGVIPLVVAARHGYLQQACRNIWLLLMYWRVAGVRPMAELTLDNGSAPRLAYATSILAGAVATLWLR